MIGVQVRRKKDGLVGVLVKDTRLGANLHAFFFATQEENTDRYRDLWPIGVHKGNEDICNIMKGYKSGWYCGGKGYLDHFELLAMENG